jgi:hypothetical protein
LASCDLSLDSSAAGGIDGQLLGSTRVRNTGDVRFTAHVTFAWLLGNGSKLSADPKTVSVQPGAQTLVVFKLPVNLDQIGLFQSHPDYYNSKNCSTKVSISAG